VIQTAENGTPAPQPQPPVIFEDPLGARFEAVSPDGEPVEVLELKDQFCGIPSFEFALRKRVNTLTAFKDPSFATARGVRLGGGLALVSDRVRGTRLSTILQAFENDLVPIEFNAAVCILRQLVAAVAVLHETMPEVSHGAIAPERIVITPEGRVVIVEHMLASALEALHYSDQQYWDEFRIAVPKTAGPACFDQRSDVLQIGLVALALIHARSLNIEEYPVPIASLAERAWAATASGSLEPLPALLRAWLTRTLQLEPKHVYGSATAVWSDLKEALTPHNQPAELRALKSALSRYGFDSLPALPAPSIRPASTVAGPTPVRTPVPMPPPALSQMPAPVPAAQMPAPPSPASAAPLTLPREVVPIPAPTTVQTAMPVAGPVRTPVSAAPPTPVRTSPAPSPTPAKPTRAPAPVPPPAAAQADSGAAMRTVRANVHDGAARPPEAEKVPTTITRKIRVQDERDDDKTARIHRPAGPARAIDEPHVARAVDQSFAARTLEPAPSPQVGVPSQRVGAASPHVGAASHHAGASSPHVGASSPRVGAGFSRPGGEPPKPFPGEPQRAADKFAIQEEPVDMRQNTPWWRRRAVAALLFVALLASAGVAGRSFFLTPSVSASLPGKLVVNTDPPGIPVVLDGKRSGETPVTLEVAPGEHVLTLLAGSGPRSIPVTIASGATVSQFVEVSQQVVAQTGELQIRTEPSGARVVVDGTPRGTAPLTVTDLAPGPHTVEVSNDLGSIRQDIMVEAGVTASLVVPMQTTPRDALSGWISIAAPPADVQVYEDTRLLGSSRIDRLMVPVGRHELDIVNEALGFRQRRSVNVTPGQVSAIRLDWPNGSMAINALPWAEVFIDGERIGETPIGNVPVPIGTHEVVFRHPELGEQTVRSTVTVGTPARISVDLRKR
jgi:hypothetical protein